MQRLFTEIVLTTTAIVVAWDKRFTIGSWQRRNTRRVYIFYLAKTMTCYLSGGKKREVKSVSVQINSAGINRVLSPDNDIWKVSSPIIDSLLNGKNIHFESDSRNYVIVEVDGVRM